MRQVLYVGKAEGKIVQGVPVSRPVVTGCAGCAMAHPDFGRSVNPISTRGDRLCPPNYYWHTRIFRPSDGPALQTVNHVTEGNLQVTLLKKLPFYCRNRGVLPGCSLGASFFYYYSSIALGNLHPGNTPHYLCQCPHSAIDSSTLQQLKYTKTHTISPTFQGNTEITPRGVTWLFPSVT